jgi:hypothetical protein
VCGVMKQRSKEAGKGRLGRWQVSRGTAIERTGRQAADR